MTDSPAPRRPSSAGSDLSVDSQDPTVSLKRVGLTKEFATTKSGASCKLIYEHLLLLRRCMGIVD